MGSRRTRVALVDRHALLTDCLATSLERLGCDSRIILVPTAPLTVPLEVQRAARRVRSFAPHVVILSGDLGPHGESEELLALLAESGVAVIVLAEEDDESHRGAYLARGARAVISQSASLTSVCALVQHLAAGLPAMSPAEQGRLVAAYRAESGALQGERDRLGRLSPTETEILQQLMAGSSCTEVAHARTVSVSTVRTQAKQIRSKLEVHSQVAAVAAAFRAGWTPTTPPSPTPTTPSTRTPGGPRPLAVVPPAA